MGPLHWGLIAVLVVYPLLQIPGVLYLSRYVELGEDERDHPPVVGYSLYPRDEDPADGGAEARAGTGAGSSPTTRRSHPEADPQASASRASRASGKRPTRTPGAVACASCGSLNDPGFAYCRDCVAELV